ncbi:NADH-quinone oxidoreductase subunit J [Caballeronia sp. LP006]|uniref:NADH-quinone oxidoreductase subunit J n=1 Tax=Caballeronia sp. LP006 TaxID=3038552 RepID=UPI0028600DAA|nr:NADH-quinone oxidoreductase subunit J [Caballeronia sp. LP006]MDR5831529.1 NADH-quinone oxidoreductase subunit J [Caballeronia sp. LP006]
MEFTTVLFYIFALLLTVSALKVITSRNPVSSALFLVLAFFNAAAIWMLLQAEFLAILLVLVYVGAVMVLFLFVVMMLDINIDVLRRDFRRFVPLASIVGAIIVVETALILWHGFGATTTPVVGAAVSGAAMMPNTQLIGKIIYTDYIFAFEIAGLVLLVAIIAAISLTIRDKKDKKTQTVSQQVKVRAQDRVRIVKMKSETEAPDAATEPPVTGNIGAGTVDNKG